MRRASLLLVLLLSGCFATTQPVVVGPDPTIAAACPPLSAPPDDTFGATTVTMLQWAKTYAGCRGALGLLEHK